MVKEQVSVGEETQTHSTMYEAPFTIEHELPHHVENEFEPETGEPKVAYLPYSGRYKVMYKVTTTHNGTTVTDDRLEINYDSSNLFGRPLFKPPVDNSGLLKRDPIVIERGKVISPQRNNPIHFAELDDLVLKALQDIQTPEIQEALSQNILGYSQLRNEVYRESA